MRRGLLAALSAFVLLSSPLASVGAAQTGASAPESASSPSPAAPPPPDFERVLVAGATEWSAGVAAGIGAGRRLASESSGYAFQALSWGRVLTGPVGPAFLRGRFEWAIEVMPLFGQFQPGRAVGVGVTPLVWRWNLERHGSMAPFAEVAAGGLWTDEPVPADTVESNFTAHVGLGMRLLTGDHRAVVLAYRFHHISNGNRADRNPGVNAHLVYVGWTTFRAPKR